MYINFKMKTHTYSATFTGNLEDLAWLVQQNKDEIESWTFDGQLENWDQDDCYEQCDILIRKEMAKGLEIKSIKKANMDDLENDELSNTYNWVAWSCHPEEAYEKRNDYWIAELSNGTRILIDLGCSLFNTTSKYIQVGHGPSCGVTDCDDFDYGTTDVLFGMAISKWRKQSKKSKIKSILPYLLN